MCALMYRYARSLRARHVAAAACYVAATSAAVENPEVRGRANISIHALSPL